MSDQPLECSPLDLVRGDNACVAPAEPSAGLRSVAGTWVARRTLVRRTRSGGGTVVDLPGKAAGSSWRNRLRARVSQGAMVIAGPWPWEDLCAAAGLDDVPDPRVGSGGGLWAKGTVRGGRPAMLRAGIGPSSPAAASTMLRELGGRQLVPGLLDAGAWSGMDWTLEELMRGSSPDRLTAGLVHQCVEWLGALPQGSGAWTAPDLPVGPMGSVDAARLRAGIDEAANKAGRLAPVMVHGDFWRGNLLVDHGRLSAVVDWDAGAFAGPPGLDLLHLIAVEERHRRRVSMGRVWQSRFWESPRVSAWLSLLDADLADPEMRRAVAVVWWAWSATNDLARQPHLRNDPRWWHNNVSVVADELQRMQASGSA